MEKEQGMGDDDRKWKQGKILGHWKGEQGFGAGCGNRSGNGGLEQGGLRDKGWKCCASERGIGCGQAIG